MHKPQRIRALPTRGPSSGIQSVLLIAHLDLGEFVGDSADALVELAMETIEKACQAGNRRAAANTFLTAAPSLVRVLGAIDVLPLLVGFMTEWRQANDVWRLRQALLYCVPGLIAFGETELAAELLGDKCHLPTDPSFVMKDEKDFEKEKQG